MKLARKNMDLFPFVKRAGAPPLSKYAVLETVQSRLVLIKRLIDHCSFRAGANEVKRYFDSATAIELLQSKICVPAQRTAHSSRVAAKNQYKVAGLLTRQ